MRQHLSSKTASQLVRATVFWFLAISGAIATATVSEFALTLNNASDKVAYAQKAECVEIKVALISTPLRVRQMNQL